MSDSQAVTIPAASRAATGETRPARLLKALAQHPEPLSTPALASLLAEPGQRRRLLASYDRTSGGTAGHVTGRPRDQWTRSARHHLAHHRLRSPLARRPRQSTRPRRGRRRRSTTQNRTGSARGHRTGPCTGRGPRHLQPPDSADKPQTRRSPAKRSRLHPQPSSSVFDVSRERIRQEPPLGACGPHTPENAEAAQAPPHRRTGDR